MNRWFRFYADAMRNPKVARLTDKEFRLWVELLAVASEHGGSIPHLDDLKHILKRRLDHLSTGVERLISMGLIDALAVGYEPHNWSKFQYKSDTSNERVTRHRAKRNVTVTPPDSDTETELPLAKANGAGAPSSDKESWGNAKSYIGGNNPGALIGKWCRDHGKPETAAAITSAQLERAADPKTYVMGILRKVKQGAAHDDLVC
jgi:hypothetical protein